MSDKAAASFVLLVLLCRREAFLTNVVKLAQPISSLRVVDGAGACDGEGPASGATATCLGSAVSFGECPGPVTARLLGLVQEGLSGSLSPDLCSSIT